MNRKPSTLLFDFGDTLFEPLPERFSTVNLMTAAHTAGLTGSEQEIQAAFKLAKQKVATKLAQVSYYRHTDYIAEAFQRCCQEFRQSVSNETALAYAHAQRDAVIVNLQPRLDSEPTLRQLRERGYRLGIVSNIDNDWFEPLVVKWRIEDWVDGILTSETARSCKPDSKIFKLACEQHQCEANDIVFIGDDEVNDIEGASKTGMTTVLLADSTVISQAAYVVHSLAALLSLDTLR